MRKILLLIFLSLISLGFFGQKLDECGIDNNPVLTSSESEYLNTYLSNEQRNGIDLLGKKILFVTGSSASRMGNKIEYFENIKEWNEKNKKIASTIIELDKKEKIESGGYDLILTYWVKVITNRRKRIIIKELKTSR